MAFRCGVALAVFATIAAAQQQVYRYVDKDGRVIYSDRAPPPDSKEVQVATQQATQRFPVTLYTFACGEVCQSAEALLNRRGVPYTTVNVEEQKGAELLLKLTGAQQAPVLQVGDKLIAKGFNEARWTAMLDEAGYPKSPPRRVATKAAEAPAGPAATAAPASPEGSQSVAVPGSGYPKQ
jgi:glutaredoxin